jgi:hypothetical protein
VTPLASHATQHYVPPAQPALTAADVRLIVRTIVDDALLPLQRALVESQQRITELERRPAASANVIVAATPAPPVVAAAPRIAAPSYTSAMAVPVHSIAPRPHPSMIGTMPPAPLLDVDAIERDVPLDFNNPFDGRRRRKRMAVFLFFALLAIFGGLAYLVADSYTPHH